MLNFNTFDYFSWLLAACLLIVPVYYLVPWERARRLLLTVLGIYLVFLIAPRLAIFYAVFWTVVAIFQRLLARLGERAYASLALTATIVALLVPLVAWKIVPESFIIWFNLTFNQVAWDLSSYFGGIDAVRDIILPIGLSFAVFRAIDLLVQTSLGTIEALPPSMVYFFGFFPPVQIIGPVIEFSELESPGKPKPPRLPSLDDLSASFALMMSGLVKVFVLAYPLKGATDVFSFYESNSWQSIWVELVLFSWFFYLNFSGYSDLSMGASRLFGYKLKPNFNNPYFKLNIQDYWNNWHMSLTRFAQRNVFIPLGGMRSRRQYLAITATMMVIALWHNISWSLFMFGLCHALVLVGARLLNGHRPAQKRPSLPLRVGKNLSMYTFVVLALPLLMIDIAEVPDFYLALLGV